MLTTGETGKTDPAGDSVDSRGEGISLIVLLGFSPLL
jgi:hypothetical protein